MFDIGFWELLLIFALGLIILGPERLPRVAAQLGNWAGQARRMANLLMTQLREEIDLEERARHPGAGAQRGAPPAWNRPGMDDLKPGHRPEGTPAAADRAPSGEAATAADADTDADAPHGPDRPV